MIHTRTLIYFTITTHAEAQIELHYFVNKNNNNRNEPLCVVLQMANNAVEHYFMLYSHTDMVFG